MAIAVGTDTDHASVIKLVRTYLSDLEEFGLVRFQIQPRSVGQHGGGETEFAVLNEQQSTLIMTYMRNSDIVRGFKKRLVKEFWLLAKKEQSPLIPQTLPDALRLAADLADQRNAAVAQLAIVTPKAEALIHLPFWQRLGRISYPRVMQ